MSPVESVKKRALTQLFNECVAKNNFVFHNEDVRRVCPPSTNHFDVTKIDNKDKLPELLIEKDYAVLHLGGGNHKFIKGINTVYHDFESIETTKDWQYKKSILNLFNSSESNILSVANNQRILHDFIFEQDSEFDDVCILKRPKTYFPHRTKTSLDYYCGSEKITATNVQIEIDLTIEFQGTVGVFEAKNGTPDSFNIYQIYHPFLYYYNAGQHMPDIKGKIKDIFAVYVVHEPNEKGTVLKLWKYTFEHPTNMASIKCLKSTAYRLVRNK